MGFQGRLGAGLMVLMAFLFFTTLSWSALDSVSGLQAGELPALTEVFANGDPAEVAVSLANGFPLWYQDDDGLKLELCLDRGLEVVQGVLLDPCQVEAAPGNPISFPGNFGAEALYWSAVVADTYTSSDGLLNFALLVYAHEAGFANEGPTSDGIQAVFSRIRLRIDLPVPGTYLITHPFGQFEYEVVIPGRRAINQTQDIGVANAQNFLVSLGNGVAPAEGAPLDPGINEGVVDENGRSIGPFLVPAQAHGGVFNPSDPATFAGGPVTINGQTYIGLPFAPDPLNPLIPLEVFQQVTGSPFNTNFLRIELLNPQGDFELNPANTDDPQVVQFDHFQIMGKVFNDGANQAPVAVDDSAATAINRSVLIDVVANDQDPVGGANVHGLNPQALALADPDSPLFPYYYEYPSGMPQLTPAQVTEQGGSVRRVNNIATGATLFLYTPPVGFSGIDRFEYLVQDHGGLLSEPALVTITVEDLALERADFRVRTGKLTLSGTSSDTVENLVTLFGGTRAFVSGAQEVPPVASEALGQVGLRLRNTGIDYLVRIDPLPSTPVTQVRLHVGEPGENGPVLAFLFFDIFDGDFGGSAAGTLGQFEFLPLPDLGIATFADMIEAIRQGRTYVKVVTSAHAAGEMRGQLVRPVIGTAQVNEDRTWQFKGRFQVGPGLLPVVSARSANQVEGEDVVLRLR